MYTICINIVYLYKAMYAICLIIVYFHKLTINHQWSRQLSDKFHVAYLWRRLFPKHFYARSKLIYGVASSQNFLCRIKAYLWRVPKHIYARIKAFLWRVPKHICGDSKIIYCTGYRDACPISITGKLTFKSSRFC